MITHKQFDELKVGDYLVFQSKRLRVEARPILRKGKRAVSFKCKHRGGLTAYNYSDIKNKVTGVWKCVKQNTDDL